MAQPGTKYITEVLKEINDDVSLFQSTYKKVGDGGPLGRMFVHAFTAHGKFLLPDGEPPFTPDAAPLGMSPIKFIAEIKKFHLFCRKDLTPAKREQMFILLIQGMHPEEAKIMIAIKDQNLTKLYPNITRKVVAAAGFIPALTPEEEKLEVVEVKKSVGAAGKTSQVGKPPTSPVNIPAGPTRLARIANKLGLFRIADKIAKGFPDFR